MVSFLGILAETFRTFSLDPKHAFYLYNIAEKAELKYMFKIFLGLVETNDRIVYIKQ